MEQADKQRAETDRVRRRLERGREAMAAVSGYDQAGVDELARAVAWAVYREDRARELANATVDETGLGTVEGKYDKLHGHLRNALAETLEGRSVGRIETDRDGVIEVAKPVGVIGALVPVTNPASTTAFLAMLAVKGRNAVVVSPPPSAARVTRRAVEYVRAELASVDAPPDLVQALEPPLGGDVAEDLLASADFAHVTGSGAAVRTGETVGTPNYCAGAANTTAIVDETADPAAAAAAVAEGTGFDNGAVCTSESNVVVDERVAAEFVDALAAEGGYVCSPAESTAVLEALYDGDSHDRSLVARPAEEIVEAADPDDAGAADFVVVQPEDDDLDRAAREKLAPVVAVLTGEGFEDLLSTARGVLSGDGTGHSCTLHTEAPDRPERLAREIDVCRAVVNQSGTLHLTGAPSNGLDTTFSLGAGVWGGNQLDENLTYRHFVTTTRVAQPTDDDAPSEAAVFGDYQGYDG